MGKKMNASTIAKALDILEDKNHKHYSIMDDMAELLDITDDETDFCDSVRAYLRKVK